MCVYTFNQTQGRGQIGRFWYSGREKNISLSYLIHFMDIPVSRHFYLNMAICLSLRDFISKLVADHEVKAKWPNDIYINNKKLAGLLIQNQLRNKSIVNSIIGIGLNVNEDTIPESLPHATSLYLQSGTEYNLISVIQDLSAFFPKRVQYYLSDYSALEANYIQALWGLNEEHSFKDLQNVCFKGFIRGVNTEGKLIVESLYGIRSYNNHEIELVLE